MTFGLRILIGTGRNEWCMFEYLLQQQEHVDWTQKISDSILFYSFMNLLLLIVIDANDLFKKLRADCQYSSF